MRMASHTRVRVFALLVVGVVLVLSALRFVQWYELRNLLREIGTPRSGEQRAAAVSASHPGRSENGPTVLR